jgi:hypothetical protein
MSDWLGYSSRFFTTEKADIAPQLYYKDPLVCQRLDSFVVLVMRCFAQADPDMYARAFPGRFSPASTSECC